VLPAVQTIEVRDAVHTKQHGFAINHELVGPDAMCGLDNERLSACPVTAVAREQPNAVHVALNDQAETVVLDFVNPVGVRGNGCTPRGDARCVG
jgi:hypothetical protein